MYLNSSYLCQGICDGAASLVLASEKAVKEHDLTPLARLVSYFTSGVEPSIMGIGPVPAIKGALSRAGKTLEDMGLLRCVWDKNSLELIELSSINKVSLVYVFFCSNTESIRDDPYWTCRKNSDKALFNMPIFLTLFPSLIAGSFKRC